jgi:hypothetical protein
MRRHSLAVVAAAGALTALAVSAPASHAVDPTFTVVDTTVNGSELNVGVAPNGSIFVGGWDAVGRSTNGGTTWTHLSPVPAVSFAADRVLVVDHDTGRVAVDDTTLGCTILSWSDDNGASWRTNPAACGGGVTDHQKIAFGPRVRYTDPTGGTLYRNLMYVCANGLSHTDCGVSVDGGTTFLPAAPHGTGCAFQGAPVAAANGTLYEPTSQCGLHVRATPDNGVTWIDHPVPYASVSDAPDVAVTPDGTLYLAYMDSSWHPAFARSTDGGVHWTGPYAVTVPGLVSGLFPTIVAGADGRVGISFYATTDDATGWDHNPGNAPDAIRWHGYVAVVTDADAATPTVSPQQVTSDPLQYGCLSKLGSCLNNIADYADTEVGPDGRVYAVFVDGCLPGCTSKAQSTSDRAILAIQSGGDDLIP